MYSSPSSLCSFTLCKKVCHDKDRTTHGVRSGHLQLAVQGRHLLGSYRKMLVMIQACATMHVFLKTLRLPARVESPVYCTQALYNMSFRHLATSTMLTCVAMADIQIHQV